MDRPSLIRGLRIAVSVVCLAFCSLVMVLWVRSYYASDTFAGNFSSKNSFMFTTSRGILNAYHFGPSSNLTLWWDVRSTAELPNLDPNWKVWEYRPNTIGTNLVVRLPLWCLVLATGLLGALALVRRPYRFSLRTLLIATTLIAAVLGLAVLTFR